MSGMKLSREGAVGNLRVFFGDSESDYVSVDDIYKNAGRSDYSLESNRKWLYNRLTLIRPYGLYEKVNGVQNGVRVTQGLALTKQGREALHGSSSHARGGDIRERAVAQQDVSVVSVQRDIDILRNMYPEFEFVFDVHFKNRDA